MRSFVFAPLLVVLGIAHSHSLHAQTIGLGEQCGYGREVVVPGGLQIEPPNGQSVGHVEADLSCTQQACYPGPGPLAGYKAWYCVDPGRNCAYPGTPGYMYNTQIGNMTCRNPGSGRRAQFY